MSYRNWVKTFFWLIGSVIALFALFNYTIDPLWTFCHSNRYNNAQPGFNERQQKTNRAYFCGLDDYDALLLGSSRTTYINQHDFEGMEVFNYAGVSMYPVEYRGWIEQAKAIKGAPFDTIILGVDFFGSNNGPFGQYQIDTTPAPSDYLERTRSFLYRYKMLFSMDTLYKSIDSIKHSKQLDTTDYTRDNVKQTIHISPQRKAQAVHHQRGLYGNSVYGKAYHYNEKVRSYLEKIKRENPDTRFIVFTTPISADLFRLLVQKGNYPDYKKWLGMLVGVFGEVYDFMGINSVTNNPENYADLHHFYPDIGTMIAKRITGRGDGVPEDFGIRVTSQNLQQHFEDMDRQAEEILAAQKRDRHR